MNRKLVEMEWYEIFPVEEKLHVSPDRTLLVDIDGGIGHDVSLFKQHFSRLPGKLVVQDLPSVIGDIKEPLPEGVEAMVYDMFEPQPLKGAKVYRCQLYLPSNSMANLTPKMSLVVTLPSRECPMAATCWIRQAFSRIWFCGRV